SLSIAAAHAAETVVLDTPRLQSIDNFRDVAGLTTAYSTAHDGTMRGGVFYRSNAITPSAADLATLNSLGIKAVYDLRTPSEIAGTPDTMLSGAT
ncbi:tyrosine-protein phosphatase, partial [Acinetobacter baumannii]|nr:tyrosine-protein phosphatase [Acinetobacter baumannii]